MARARIWFGKPGAFRWVPAPASGMGVQNSGYSEAIDFINGGADVVRSNAFHKIYELDFPVQESVGYEGLDVYTAYASGVFGDGLLYLADPMAYHTNLFPMNWSAPGLREQGWKPVYDVEPTFADTASNSYLQPGRSAVFNITDSADAVPVRRIIIPVPPTHVLHVGVSGSATGDGVLRARPINADGTYAATSDLTLLDPTMSTRFNTTFAGSSYAAVEFYITRSDVNASTLTLTSLMAQLRLPGEVFPLVGNFIPGQGNTGLKFGDAAIPETYVMADRLLKGLSTRLVEVGQWQ